MVLWLLGPDKCDTCHITLAPHETMMDLGDGLERICDGCLHGSRAN